MTTCERCGYKVPAESYALLDYCANCSKNLCEKCMKEGCCGVKPAESGTEDDMLVADEELAEDE